MSYYLSHIDLDNIADFPTTDDLEEEEEGEQIQYPFYTQGPPKLLQARLEIASYSLPRAKARIERARRTRRDDPEKEAKIMVKTAGGFELDSSEIGDERPLTGCSFSRDASMLATSSWTGGIKIWSTPQQLTASADKTAKLWNTDGSLLRSFDGHLDRLARIAFHPSGKYLGTASFDKTWRLWDINTTGKELLLQEGHSTSVYGIAFHPDGSLAASCGLDALARVWDLRSGRSVLAFQGHVKTVLAVSFSPNGYMLATGGEDNFCRIWDLRKRSIPAHKSSISQVKFEPRDGCFLVTSSFDHTAALWSAQDFKPIKNLVGHESPVNGLDSSFDGQQIATVSRDRTIKIWTCKNSGQENDMDVH